MTLRCEGKQKEPEMGEVSLYIQHGFWRVETGKLVFTTEESGFL